MASLSCPHCRLKYLATGAPGCPRCGAPPPSIDALATGPEASPVVQRLRGVGVALVGVFMLAANAASTHLANRFYPALVALGGAAVGMGLWQATFGGEYRAGSPGGAPPWKRAGLGASAVLGLALALASMWVASGD